MSGSSTGDRPNEVRVGAHLFRWEPPDVGYTAYHGDLDGEAMVRLSTQSREFTLGQPRVFLLVDMTRIGKISAEARRASASGSTGLVLRGIAVFGASAALRIIAGFVARATDLMNRNNDNPTRFFETEAEARAWIDARRTALRQAAARRDGT